jgi:Rod binding domain-containing protein
MSDFRIAPSAGSSSLTQANTDLAVRGLRNPATKDSKSKIDKAAHDFESLLVGQWLDKAEKSFATVPGADPDRDQDSSHDQFQSIACENLAKSLGKTGGFGIASMISKHLAAAEAKHPADGAPAAPSVTAFQVTLNAAKLKNDK